MSAFVTGPWIPIAQLALFIGTGLLALRASPLPQRRVRLLSAAVVTVSVVAAVLALTQPSADAVAAASIWTGALLLATVALIVRRILSFGTVTGQSILGAVSAYMIVGLMFAAFYSAIAKLDGGHFFADGRTGNTETFQYFSFTTLTTLGYGDFTAAGNDGRALAVIEALTGQVFLATLVARLVAAFRGPRAPAGEPAPGLAGDGGAGRSAAGRSATGDGGTGDGGAGGGGAGPGPQRAGRRPRAGLRAGRRPRWRRPPPGRPS
jgi:Ion channel